MAPFPRFLEVLRAPFAALLLLPVLLAGSLAACGGGRSSVQRPAGGRPASSARSRRSPSPRTPTPAKTLDTTVLSEGDGPKVGKGDLLVADYLGEIYKSGKVFDNSYDRKQPAAFPIGAGRSSSAAGTRAWSASTSAAAC